MAPVLVGVVGPAVADPVALGEGAVEQDEFGIVLAQRLEQTRCSFGEQVDDRAGVGVGGGLADPDPAALWCVRAGTPLPPSRAGTDGACSAGRPHG